MGKWPELDREKTLHLETINITDGSHAIRVEVHLHQNGVTGIIASELRRFIPDREPLEKTHARALVRAAEWLAAEPAGAVNLRDLEGQYVRT